MPVSVTSPTRVQSNSHFSKIAFNSLSNPCSITTNIRSWLSESIISYAFILSSLKGTLSKSIFMPDSPFADISEQEHVIPAAPISWIPTNHNFLHNSKDASMSSFSVNGSPTCTFDRLDSVSSVSSTDANVAP